MAQNSGTDQLMKSNRGLSVAGIIIPAVFAMEKPAQAFSFRGLPLSHEPVSFLIVGLVLAVLPMIRKKRS